MGAHRRFTWVAAFVAAAALKPLGDIVKVFGGSPKHGATTIGADLDALRRISLGCPQILQVPLIGSQLPQQGYNVAGDIKYWFRPEGSFFPGGAYSPSDDLNYPEKGNPAHPLYLFDNAHSVAEVDKRNDFNRHNIIIDTLNDIEAPTSVTFSSWNGEGTKPQVIAFGFAELSNPLRPDEEKAVGLHAGQNQTLNIESDERVGDVWFANNHDLLNNAAGFKLATLHEIGHALGLSHPEDVAGTPPIPDKELTLQFTVMNRDAYLPKGQPKPAELSAAGLKPVDLIQR